jgi:hypothetical protein
MRNLILVWCLILSVITSAAYAQSDSNKIRSRPYFECMVVPAVIYNSASVGFSKMSSERAEHAIYYSGLIFFTYGRYISSVALRYNYNLILSQKRKLTTYLPLWTAARFLDVPAIEELYPVQYFFYTVGTGYGAKFKIFGNQFIRAEAGIGVSIYQVRYPYSIFNKMNTFNFPVRQFVPAARLSLRYMLPF